jgi:hypothetical protein
MREKLRNEHRKKKFGQGNKFERFSLEQGVAKIYSNYAIHM